MSGSTPKVMKRTSMFMMVSALLVFAAGAYLVFMDGRDNGVVLMGLGTTLTAVSAVFGSRAKQLEAIGNAR